MNLDGDESERKYRAPALEKGLDVLELLAARRGPLTLSQISTALERSASELFRMVQVLEFRGYLVAAPSGEGFVLSDKLFALGTTRAPTRSLLEAALPLMRRLSAAIGQSCHLVVASGDQMVVIARIEAPGDYGFSVRLGYRQPLVSTTSGLVLFAFQTDAVRAAWRELLLPTLDDTDWTDFERRAAQARQAGHVRVASPLAKQILDLSVPVMGRDEVSAALTTPYAETPTAIGEPETIRLLKLTAADISAELISS